MTTGTGNTGTRTATPRLGLAANAAQFSLLVAVNALVGGLLGSERTVLPLLAEHTFHLGAYTAALTYILAFGATKAAINFFAGTLSAHYGLRPAPFLLAAAYAALGLGLSALSVRETRGHAHHEAATGIAATGAHHGGLSTRQVFALVSFREPALSAASQAGMVNNLNDGLAWGLFPILFATAGLS